MILLMYMVYTVSITSQGQISIPAPIRRQLDLDRKKKAVVRVERDRVIIEPVRDLLDLGGSLKTKIKVSPRKTRQMFIEYLANRSK